LDRQVTTGKVVRLPVRSDVDSPINEQLIVEFYSR
jgi:ribosomal protein S4